MCRHALEAQRPCDCGESRLVSVEAVAESGQRALGAASWPDQGALYLADAADPSARRIPRAVDRGTNWVEGRVAAERTAVAPLVGGPCVGWALALLRAPAFRPRLRSLYYAACGEFTVELVDGRRLRIPAGMPRLAGEALAVADRSGLPELLEQLLTGVGLECFPHQQASENENVVGPVSGGRATWSTGCGGTRPGRRRFA